MNIDIKVTITSYIAADSYKVNIYRQGSTIAVMSKDVAEGAGAIVEFLGLASGFSYEAEVIHYCADGTQSSKRGSVSAPSVPACMCPSGFIPNADNTKCVHTDVINATYVAPAYNVGAGPNEGAYCMSGIRVYAPGFTIDGRGTRQYESGNTHVYWASHMTTTDGRLNIAGVWNSADSSAPLNTWIGFSKTITIGTSQLYWVAIAGDNYCRIKVNGTVIVDQKQNTVEASNINFNYWHCYPVWLNAGTNVIELEGYNDNGIGSFAAEIYNCTLDNLKNVTMATEGTLNRVFSTMDATEFNNNYTCPDGYALDASDPLAVKCRKVEYVACG